MSVDRNEIQKDAPWMGRKGFDEARYYNDEKYEIGLNHPDQLIKEKVEEAYSRHPSLSIADIDVQVKNGLVYLTGHVHGPEEKKEASDLICNLTGIKAVKNDLS
jgi:osmotically-inducible protein OsmY